MATLTVVPGDALQVRFTTAEKVLGLVRRRTLVSVRRGQLAVVVDLAGHRFARLVIGTDDATDVVSQLTARP